MNAERVVRGCRFDLKQRRKVGDAFADFPKKRIGCQLTWVDSVGIKIMGTRKVYHSGSILREESMEPVNLTPYKGAKALEVPLPRMSDIILEKRSISTEMGLLLSAYFGTTDRYWINLQADYDRREVRSRIEKKLKSIKPQQRIR